MTPSTSVHPRPPWLATALRLMLAFGLLGLAIYLNRDQVRAVADRPVDRGRFALAFVAYLTGLLLAFVRWFLLVRVIGLPFRMRDALRLGFIGNLFNLVIPGAVGGDVIKAAYLCREQERKAQAVASIVVDRVIGLLGLFGLASVVGVLAWGRLDSTAHRLVYAGLVLLGILVAALVVLSSPAFHRRPARGPRQARRRVELAEAAAAFRGHPATAALALVMALATHSLNVLAFSEGDQALYRTVPTPIEHAVIVPLVLFSTAFPLPLGALGFSEEVGAQLFRLVGFEGGAVGVMAFRLLQYGGAMIGAFIYLPNRRKVRTLIASSELVAAGSAVGE